MEPRASSSLSITSMNNTLTARDSLQQIRRLSEESIDGSNVTNHERMWRLSYLKVCTKVFSVYENRGIKSKGAVIEQFFIIFVMCTYSF